MRTVLAATAAFLMFASAALAVPPVPSGTLTGPATGVYGGTVTFDASVDAQHGDTYITVVCAQGSTVVYQWSSLELGFAFPLTDQAGDNLEWDGGGASCEAALVNRVKHGRGVILTTLDTTTFEVA